MLQYHITNTSIPIELVVLSGGTTVTGLTPYVKIRHKDLGTYFDFADRTFGGVLTSATGKLLSAVDGLYRMSWDTSGLFTTSTFLTFEYHESTSLSVEDVLFTRPPISSGDATHGGGGANVYVRGQWSLEEKEKLFDKLSNLNNDLVDFRRKALILLRDILAKESLNKEDIKFLVDLKEKDNVMWTEMLKILKLDHDSSADKVLERLEQYTSKEETAKKEVLHILNEKMKVDKDISMEDDE